MCIRDRVTAAAVKRTIFTLAIVVVIRFFCERMGARSSYLACVDVKRILREKIYEKMLKLGASYSEQVSSSEVVQAVSYTHLQAVSLSPIDIMSMQITKSVNSEDGKEGKASDTMGTKHRVGFAVYKVMGSVNVQLAEKTGFTQEDAEILKEALMTLFENDASSARPEGSMRCV